MNKVKDIPVLKVAESSCFCTETGRKIKAGEDVIFYREGDQYYGLDSIHGEMITNLSMFIAY